MVSENLGPLKEFLCSIYMILGINHRVGPETGDQRGGVNIISGHSGTIICKSHIEVPFFRFRIIISWPQEAVHIIHSNAVPNILCVDSTSKICRIIDKV